MGGAPMNNAVHVLGKHLVWYTSRSGTAGSLVRMLSEEYVCVAQLLAVQKPTNRPGW